MIETILKALIQLFALISDVRDISEISSRERDIVRLFLSRQLNSEMVNKYMEMFDEYIKQYIPEKIDRGSIKDMKRTSLTAVKILAAKTNVICFSTADGFYIIRCCDNRK